MSAARSTDSARFGALPPAYHDEYSYLFQAKTFLARCWWFPSHAAAPELFDQVHVLNDGRFASRYFPGAGAWMAPFVACDRPLWGHRLAGCLLAACLYFVGREIGGQRLGLLAGALAALCPALALFSNLLLAHHPTLAGLGLFLVGIVRFQKTRSPGAALIAGIGLGFAMICRPMTAAGFALPWGVWMAGWLIGKSTESVRRRAACTVLMGLPLVAGAALLAMQNHAVTGDWRVTPYQLYTDLHTPRHVYGFNNVTRGEQRVGPKTLENYDRWAENLTPRLAARNVARRIVASGQWTLGLVPLLMSLVVFCGLTLRSDARWKWILASIVSLHVVHVPYWFDGIMHWHYVFETAPLLLLVAAGATCSAFDTWRRDGRALMPAWWGVVLIAALATAYVAVDFFVLFVTALAAGVGAAIVAFARRGSARPAIVGAVVAVACLGIWFAWPWSLWPIARLDAAVSEISFSRLKYASFRARLAPHAASGPILVLVKADPADRHIDYVTNDPTLDGPILIGRWPADGDIERIRRLFADRALYLFDAATDRLTRAP